MKKIYVVIKGKIPGIYYDWKHVEENVKGFKGAIFKSFNDINQANQYFNSFKNTLTQAENNKDIVKSLNEDSINKYYSFFVDGSYNKINKKIGYGFVCIKNNQVFYQESNQISDYEYLNFKQSLNITGEIVGTMKLINYSLKNNFEKIKIYYDYEGIEKWFNQLWKPNSKIAIYYQNFSIEIKNKNIEILFQKVKSHSNIEFNDLADQLAKSAIK